jgi:hypothetical protein
MAWGLWKPSGPLLAVGPRASTNGGPFRFVARNITVGQKAMGYAMLLPDPERWAGQETVRKT